MGKIFIISDTHFSHSNILKFKDRKGAYFRGDLFKDEDHMNETMINNWNSVVSPEDKVYHLGDVYFGSGQKANDILHRLNGKKRLILGNHDNGRDQVLRAHFKKILLWRKWGDYGVIMSHIPLHESCLGGFINIHGHIHQNSSPKGPYINACVEQNNYTPVDLLDLIKQAKRKLQDANYPQ